MIKTKSGDDRLEGTGKSENILIVEWKFYSIWYRTEFFIDRV